MTPRKWIDKLLTGALVTAGVGLATHLITQGAYTVNRHQQPSEIRQAFNKEFNTSIVGWATDIENNETLMRNLTEVMAREKQEHPFTLKEIEIESAIYFKKDLSQQMDHLFRPTEGRAFRDAQSISILNETDIITNAHHEIKHIKTYEALHRDPTFEARYKALAQDSQGNSLYRSKKDQEKYLSRWNHQNEDNFSCQKEGFITCYAKQNFLEDIAELGERIESDGLTETTRSNSVPLSTLLKQKIFRDKVLLLQEQGIIAPEFLEAQEIYELLQQSLRSHSREPILFQKFIEESDRFLSSHPNSIYTLRLSYLRGNAIIDTYVQSTPNNYDSTSERKLFKDNRMTAIAEWERGLQSKFKPQPEYQNTLLLLRDAYRELQCGKICEENSETYTRALIKFNGRLQKDRSVFTKGVDDYLQQVTFLKRP